MNKVFEPLKLKNVTLKNRIVMSAMSMHAADQNGYATEFTYLHYVTRAMGGVGMIILEETAIESGGRVEEDDLGIWSDEHIPGLQRIVEGIKSYRCVPGIELGRVGSTQEYFIENVERSERTNKIRWSPNLMTKKDLARVVTAYKNAAIRAKKAGFSVVEIHAAHGYLLTQIISPITNHRNDEYGGSHQNRIRLLGEIVDAVSSVFSGVIGVRISASDHMENGNRVEDLAIMLNELHTDKIDFVDVTSGFMGQVSNEVYTSYHYSGYQLKYAEYIKKHVNLPTIAGGLMQDPFLIEEAIHNNRTDMVYVGRELLRNPYFPVHVAEALNADSPLLMQYEKASMKNIQKSL